MIFHAYVSLLKGHWDVMAVPWPHLQQISPLNTGLKTWAIQDAYWKPNKKKEMVWANEMKINSKHQFFKPIAGWWNDRISPNIPKSYQCLIPYAPCTVYLPTFGWFLGQMLVNIPYMEHMGMLSKLDLSENRLLAPDPQENLDRTNDSQSLDVGWCSANFQIHLGMICAKTVSMNN